LGKLKKLVRALGTKGIEGLTFTILMCEMAYDTTDGTGVGPTSNTHALQYLATDNY